MNSFNSLYRVFKLDPSYAKVNFLERYDDLQVFSSKQLEQAKEMLTFEYESGVNMSQFESDRIKEKSSYNNNYYKGFNNDVLLEECDDLGNNEWYLISCSAKILLGVTDESNILLKLLTL